MQLAFVCNVDDEKMNSKNADLYHVYVIRSSFTYFFNFADSFFDAQCDDSIKIMLASRIKRRKLNTPQTTLLITVIENATMHGEV